MIVSQNIRAKGRGIVRFARKRKSSIFVLTNNYTYLIMKKIIFMLLAIATNLVVSAQQPRIYLGLNVSNASEGLPGIATKPDVGFQAGADVQFGKAAYIQTGLQYNVTHIALSHDALPDKQSNLWVSGVKVPVMAGLRLPVLPSANLRLYTGPSFMAVTSVQHKNMNDANYRLTDKNYHDIEWAWHLGCGWDVKRIFIDLGFQKGLTYIFTGGSKARGNQLYLNVGYRFLKK